MHIYIHIQTLSLSHTLSHTNVHIYNKILWKTRKERNECRYKYTHTNSNKR